ncbi:MAG TPA: DUF4136 domain-containing protein [Vicinamibacteria bacterium]|nr:DUF4136 domain-containing protein [Vicinamibacteria bacterium]
MRYSRFVVAFTLIGATTATAQTVRVRWERTVDFSRYQSYMWIEGARALDDQAHRLVVDSTDATLAVAGIFKDEFEPDLYVTYYASVDESFQISGGYRRDWNDARAVTVETHAAGTLVIDLVDAAENQLVWQASATAALTNDMKKNRDKVREALSKMFADFPPSN